ncbi:MAG: DUF1638 domain-containing protein [Armatimonadota bacterium]
MKDNEPRDTRRLKVVACGVFEPELQKLVNEVGPDIDLQILDAGLHAQPEKLRRQLQQAIDDARGENFDGIVACYGLCGRGTSGIVARHVPVALLKVHDCITLFLGSREAYREQFNQHPGTFYITPGWYENKISVDDETSFDRRSLEAETDPRFARWVAQFGNEDARWLQNFYDSWKRNYTRAVYINTLGDASDEYAEYTRRLAEAMGWEYEEIPGRPDILRRALSGQWSGDDIVVIRPGQKSVATGDDRVLQAVDVDAAVAPRRDLPDKTDHEITAGNIPDIVALGIDAGGTYTDCVAYDFSSDTLLGKSKALTTPHDLIVGIEQALDAMPDLDTSAIRMVALSTTLATNAIVEDRGGRPGALLMAPGNLAEDAVDWPYTRIVSGEMSVTGEPLADLDAGEIRRLVKELIQEGADAFAVSGYGSVRNPDHEQRVQDVIGEVCDLPVVCGHHLSTNLDFTSRARTAILNARLLSVISQLLDAVALALQRRGIHAPLMVVRGDGSLMNEKTARRRPVETILSGPSASVIGARFLTDISDGLVVDMGGTTTDTARVSEGLPELHDRGANVNGWRLSVEATDIATVGLGGDSHVRFDAERTITVGPRRVIPLSYLADHSQQAREQIMALDPLAVRNRSNADALDFFTLGAAADKKDHLIESQRRMLEALADGPLSRAALARRLGLQSPRLLRTEDLEDNGYIQRSALTPTDVLHTTGEFVAWDREAATHALEVFADLYGAPPDAVAERIHETVVEKLCLQVLLASYRLSQHDSDGCDCELCRTMLDSALSRADGQPMRVRCEFTQDLVAIGAPVRAFFPDLAEQLQAKLTIPEHAEVANAIGAVASEVIAHERVIIRPGEIGNYVVHSRDARSEYVDVERAIQAAREQASAIALRRAGEAGAPGARVRVDTDSREVRIADGSLQLVEITIDATAAGRPSLTSR